MLVSAIVELDNSGARPRQLLAELEAQLAAQPRPYEILVVRDPARVDFAAAGTRAVAAPGARYYAQKNAGAQAARGDVLLFVDSDITPEAGFVEQLLAPLDDPAIHAVTGSCYVGPVRTLSDKAFALCWYFPLRPTEVALRPTTHLWANSFAVRRDVFARHPFVIDERLRGACVTMVRDLRRSGVTLWQARGARCAHPTPGGWLTMARRALWEGHDRTVARRADGKRPVPPARAARQLASAVLVARRRIDEGAARLGVRPHERPVLLAAAAGYELLIRVGSAVARAAPAAIPALLPR